MKIFVCKEKHGNSYYDASTPEAQAKSALEILKKRVGYYITDPTVGENGIISPWYKANLDELVDLKTALDLLEVNEDSISYKEAKRRYQDKLRNVHWYETEKKLFIRATAALSNQDGKEALEILLDRRDYEYEGFDIETVWTGK